MDDWGEIKLLKVGFEDGSDFWCIYDELCDDKSEFLNNRTYILDAYKNGNLYGLRVNESDQMYKRGAYLDTIFCKDSFYLLPCFCIKEDNNAIIIWTHTRARRMGFAKTLIKLLNIEYAKPPILTGSDQFWTKCNVKPLS